MGKLSEKKQQFLVKAAEQSIKDLFKNDAYIFVGELTEPSINMGISQEVVIEEEEFSTAEELLKKAVEEVRLSVPVEYIDVKMSDDAKKFLVELVRDELSESICSLADLEYLENMKEGNDLFEFVEVEDIQDFILNHIEERVITK